MSNPEDANMSASKEEKESDTPKTTAFGLHLEEWERKAYENKEKEAAALAAISDDDMPVPDDDVIDRSLNFITPHRVSPSELHLLRNELMSHHSIVSDNSSHISDNEDEYYPNSPDRTDNIINAPDLIDAITISDDTEEEEGAIGFERSSDGSDYYDADTQNNKENESNGGIQKQLDLYKKPDKTKVNGINFSVAAVNVDWNRHCDQQVELENNNEQYIKARDVPFNEEDRQDEKVDDDEDRRNPQYIPKRGTFYEHDDRTLEDVKAPPEKKEMKSEKKKCWPPEKKWDHGGYNDELQKPKTREEIIAQYGFDIRAEDGPPRARRRRRYGRGPNQYTRKWEDEQAYGKPTASAGRGRGRPNSNNSANNNINPENIRRDREEFPPLGSSRNHRNSAESGAITKDPSTNSSISSKSSSSHARNSGYSSVSTRTSNYSSAPTRAYSSAPTRTSNYSSAPTRTNNSSAPTKPSSYSSEPSKTPNYSSPPTKTSSYPSSAPTRTSSYSSAPTRMSSKSSVSTRNSNYSSPQNKSSYSFSAPTKNSSSSGKYSVSAKKQAESTKSADARTSAAPVKNSSATRNMNISTYSSAGPSRSSEVQVKSYTFNNRSTFKNSKSEQKPLESNHEASNQQLVKQNTNYNRASIGEPMQSKATQIPQNQDEMNRNVPEKLSENSVQEIFSEVPERAVSLNGQQSFENAGSTRGILVDSIIVNPLPRGRSRSVPTQVFLPSNVPLRGRGRGIRTKHSTVAEFIGASNALFMARTAQCFSPEKDDMPEDIILSPDAILPAEEDLIADMSSLTVSDQSLQYITIDHSPRKNNQSSPSYILNNERQQAVVPPRLQDVLTNRPKRYSTLRQRPPQETGLQQGYIPAQNFFTQGFIPQQVYSEPAPSANSTQLQLISHVNVSNGAYQTSYTAGPYIQQATNIIQQPPPNMIQPSSMLQQPPPSNIIQAPTMIPQSPPNLIQQTPPNIIPQHPPPFVPQNPPPTQVLTYMAGPSQPQFQTIPAQNFQPFQSYTPVPEWNETNVCVPPPAPGQTELFRPPVGITYYSPEEQVAPRFTQKRQRSAIPIVPPPEGMRHNVERSRGNVSTADGAEERRNLNTTLEAQAAAHIIDESHVNEFENHHLALQNRNTSETDNGNSSMVISEVPFRQDM